MYSFDSRIRYTELNENLKLPLVSIVNYFQDCSTFQSESLGKGLTYLRSNHQAWMVTGWQIDLFDEALPFENVKISTWPYKFDMVLGYRNFTIESTDRNKVIAVGSSMWALVDTIRHKPLRLKSEDTDGYELSPAYEIDYLPRKVKLPDHEFISLEKQLVVEAHLDSNMHVNNGQYLSFADNLLPDGFTYNRLRAEYKKSALLGDYIYPKYCICDNVCYMNLCDEAGKTYAVIEFSTRNA